MIDCEHCGKEVAYDEEDNTILIARGNLNKLQHFTLNFHLDCWKEVSGNQYIPNNKLYHDHTWNIFLPNGKPSILNHPPQIVTGKQM